jgi:WD40 repeat protein
LQHAHQHGLIHRDIKPHNLMLTRSGRVKVLDFGLARIGRAAAETSSEGITASNVIMGTPDYMAPEQTSSAHAVDIRADIYSLGCTLYHLLTGQVPFPGGTVIDKLMKHNTERPEQVEQLRPEVPHELAKVVRKMMAKEPDRRFQTPAEVAEALAEFASPAPDEAFTAQTALVSGRRPSTGASAAQGEESAAAVQNRRAIWAAIAVAVVLVVAAVGMVIYLNMFLNREGSPIAREPSGAKARPANAGRFLGNLDKEGPPLKEIRQFKGHSGAVSSVSVSPSGEFLLTGGQDKTVRLWEIASGREVRQFKGHTDMVSVVVFSPDGKQALSGGGDNTLRLWDVATGNEVRRFEGHTDAIAGIAFLPDGKSAVTAGDDQTYRLWDLATGETIRKMEEPPGEGYRFGKIAVSADGKQLAAGGKGDVVRLWNLETGELERPVATKHNGPVTGVAYYADDLAQGIVSGARNDTVMRFWLFRLNNQSVFLSHTTTGIASVAASTVKRAAVAGGADGSLSLCSIIDGHELGHAAAHQGPVFGVAFTPDGKQLVSCGKDGTVRLWEVP